MNYNQLSFWFLFAAVYLLYRRGSHRRQNVVLLIGSYIFYGFWDHRFLFLIVLSTAIDFIGGLGVAGTPIAPRLRRVVAGSVLGSALLFGTPLPYGALWSRLTGGGAALPAMTFGDFKIPLITLVAIIAYGQLLPRLYAMPEARRRKTFLVISMVANLGILGFFKYYDFFVSSFHTLLASTGLVTGPAPVLNILLPAGISFYTFQAMSYTIDIYRRECEPTSDYWDFSLFVCFFPHLVAGPIMRAHSLLPQVLQPRTTSVLQFNEGFVLILIGLFKKMVLSDSVAPIANAVFIRLANGDTATLSGAEVLLGIYAFALQIYGDFSGYSAIARGISKWLGFELVLNFREPYIATTPSDFWRRWHISLSTWLRDYLYIPLGGNRKGVTHEYRNLMITMLLGGLWHGASWTFVAWGLYHGLILCGFRALKIRDVTPQHGWLRYLLRLGLMFHLTCLGWLLFRADNFQAITTALRLIFTSFGPSLMLLAPICLMAFYALALMVVERWLEGEERITRLFERPVVAGLVCTYFIFMIALFRAGKTYEFIYFQF